MSEKSKEFMELALRRFRQASEAESEIREKALEDYQFYIGEGNQWPEKFKREREASGEPCLEINDLPRSVAQVVNEIRRSPPQITAAAVEDSDVDKAERSTALLRRIQFEASAQEAYIGAAQHAAIMGFGFYRVATEYENEEAGEQNICIDPIPDPFTVYFDPAMRKLTGADARFCFVVEDIDKEAFEERFPGKEPASAEEMRGTGDISYWNAGRDMVRIAEYWYVEEKQRTKILGGPMGYLDEIEDDEKMLARVKNGDFQTRPITERKVKWCMIDGVKVLEEREWGSKYIGIVPVYGEVNIVGGKKYIHGMIRHVKDPQRMRNYWISAATRAVALAPRAPFIAVEGQLEGHEREWEESATRNIAVLQYRNVDVGGKPAPPPQRQVYEPPIQAMSQMLMLASDQVKSTFGIYAAGLGDVGPERSGKAILARQQESDTSNAHIGQALRRSLAHAGKIIAELIPVVYDTPRVVRVLEPDNTSSTLTLNKPFLDKQSGTMQVLDPSTWKFDVQANIGPTYETQRQAAADSIANLIKAFPPVMEVAGDLLVSSMDIPHAAEIAKRMKALLPPNLQEEGQNTQIPPQVQAQMQALMQQHEALTQTIEQLTKEIEGKQAELESKERIAAAEVSSREKIAAMQVEADLVKTQAQIDAENAVAVLKAEIEVLKTQLGHQSAERMAEMQPAEPEEAAPDAE